MTEPPAEATRRHRAGLCAFCAHHRKVVNRRQSVFYMCQRAKTDPRFVQYPPLPVLACPGFERGEQDPWEKELG